jgi:hypothetical protein
MQMAPILSPLDDVGASEHVQELGAHERLHRRAGRERHRAARDLLQRDAELRELHAAAAHVLGVAHAEKPHARELAEELAREGVSFVERRRARRDALVAEAREALPYLLLLRAWFEVHATCSQSLPTARH